MAKLSEEDKAAIKKVAADFRMEYAELLAICRKEISGKPLERVTVDGSPQWMPPIRIEFHWVRKLLLKHAPKTLEKAKARGLAYRGWREGTHPKSQQKRYDNLSYLSSLHYETAYLASSVGASQTMGFNHDLLGFNTAYDMHVHARTFVGQIELIALFFKAKGLVGDMAAGRFGRVAEVYNGPQYRKNNYDTDIKGYYLSAGGKPLVRRDYVTYAQRGDRGPRVKDLQIELISAGYRLKADSIFGQQTESIVMAYQASRRRAGHDEEPDGVMTVRQMSALKKRFDPTSEPRVIHRELIKHSSKAKHTIAQAGGLGGVSVIAMASNYAQSPALESVKPYIPDIVTFLKNNTPLVVGVGLLLFAAWIARNYFQQAKELREGRYWTSPSD